MTPLSCAQTRRRLTAFHDQELPVPDQIDVGGHLEWCRECADAFAEMRFVRAALRSTAVGRDVLTRDEMAGFHAAVVNRVKVEADASFLARVERLFDDMHFVYAGCGAAVATIVCVVIMLGMMRFATIGRPDSLAAIVNILGSPGSNENPVPIDAHVQMPRVLDLPRPLDSMMPVEPAAGRNEDSEFTLAGVVTREGRIANLELLSSPTRESAADAKLIAGVMNAVSGTRFEPASVGGAPVAVNMVWLVAHTTVRASKHHRSVDQPLTPPGKKRIASFALAIPVNT